jgi:lipid-A-disaccharide synthase
MKYFIIAGERSGDLHAGNLVTSLKKLDKDPVLEGFGGEYMASAGVNILVHYKDMAVMGFWEVVMNLRKIGRYIDQCKQQILRFKPDVVILVDYGGFNKRIAAWARKNSIPVFYYISPKVWAWNQKRALKLKATVDRMFVIMPFEKHFYRRFGWEVDYVGNPVLDAVKAHIPDPDFRARHQLTADRPVVALLPGSRKQELVHIAPIMSDVCRRFPEVRFVVATVSNIDPALYQLFTGTNITFVNEDTYNLLMHSRVAVVTSGTATLETALFRVPQVVVYRTSPVSYIIAKSLIQVPYISLVNLIAGKEVVRELIQNDFTAANIALQVATLLEGPARDAVLKEYDTIYNTLNIGSASENAALKMWQYLTKR